MKTSKKKAHGNIVEISKNGTGGGGTLRVPLPPLTTPVTDETQLFNTTKTIHAKLSFFFFFNNTYDINNNKKIQSQYIYFVALRANTRTIYDTIPVSDCAPDRLKTDPTPPNRPVYRGNGKRGGIFGVFFYSIFFFLHTFYDRFSFVFP